MRISDWIQTCALPISGPAQIALPAPQRRTQHAAAVEREGRHQVEDRQDQVDDSEIAENGADDRPPDRSRSAVQKIEDRSEEHTSELQSLMRQSYAVY